MFNTLGKMEHVIKSSLSNLKDNGAFCSIEKHLFYLIVFIYIYIYK